jgi:hypothetical protein
MNIIYKYSPYKIDKIDNGIYSSNVGKFTIIDLTVIKDLEDYFKSFKDDNYMYPLKCVIYEKEEQITEKWLLYLKGKYDNIVYIDLKLLDTLDTLELPNIQITKLSVRWETLPLEDIIRKICFHTQQAGIIVKYPTTEYCYNL